MYQISGYHQMYHLVTCLTSALQVARKRRLLAECSVTWKCCRCAATAHSRLPRGNKLPQGAATAIAAQQCCTRKSLAGGASTAGTAAKEQCDQLGSFVIQTSAVLAGCTGGTTTATRIQGKSNHAPPLLPGCDARATSYTPPKAIRTAPFERSSRSPCGCATTYRMWRSGNAGVMQR